MQKGRASEATTKVAKHLLVKYPAELTWYNVACHVLDQKTLKLKQVRHWGHADYFYLLFATSGAFASGDKQNVIFMSYIYQDVHFPVWGNMQLNKM